MIAKLGLKRFKNFEKAEITLGPLTVLIGTNASGKSNLRDAFRFLHGIGRGYTFAEILGEKYGPGGELVWKGIRGGPREIAYREAETFALELITVDLNLFRAESDSLSRSNLGSAKYRIEVAPSYENSTTRLVKESLHIGDESVFEASLAKEEYVNVTLNLPDAQDPLRLIADRPLLPRIPNLIFRMPQVGPDTTILLLVDEVVDILRRMQFLEPVPEALRQPSFPGQRVLGDRGEHLASVLQIICADPKLKQALVNQVRELTPMDVVDFNFLPDHSGKVLLELVEENKQRVSAYSASDGTLRFLSILADLLHPEPPRLSFYEELENGLHPTRLYLLLDFIQKQAEKERLQAITTSHSPQMLRFLNAKSRDHVALMYRLPDSPAAHIKQLRDFPPEARKVIESKDLAELHDSGWFETVASFMQGEE
jgi:predicted ATPase